MNVKRKEEIECMTKEQKKMETALLEFIERECEEPSTEKSIEVIPQMAHELIELWTI